MKSILPAFAILFVGVVTALEGATNGWVGKTAASFYFALLVCFCGSALLLVVALPFVPLRPHWYELRQLPWYAWATPPYVLLTIGLAAWATPKLGAGPALIAALLSQTAVGFALDHFALLGLERSPMTWLKAVGFAVMLAGATVIATQG